jgi:hypothetical protein
MVATDKQRQGTREALSALRRQFQQHPQQQKAWLLPAGASAALGPVAAGSGGGGPGGGGAFPQSCGTTLCFARYKGDEALRVLEEGACVRRCCWDVRSRRGSRRPSFSFPPPPGLSLTSTAASPLPPTLPSSSKTNGPELARLDARLDALRTEQKRLTAKLADAGAAPQSASLDAMLRLRG